MRITKLSLNVEFHCGVAFRGHVVSLLGGGARLWGLTFRFKSLRSQPLHSTQQLSIYSELYYPPIAIKCLTKLKCHYTGWI